MFTEATSYDIKRALKKEFNHPFRVRQQGRWAHIYWTDGPTYDMVNDFCAKYNDNSRDDITTDLMIGSQYTLLQRDFSKGENVWLLLNKVDLRLPFPPLNELIKNACEMLTHRNGQSSLSWNNKDIEFGDSYAYDIYNIQEAFKALGYNAVIEGNKLSIN